MRSLIVRPLAAIPILCLFVLLFQAAQEVSPPPTKNEPGQKSPRSRRSSPQIQTPVEPPPIDYVREDAQVEIEQLRLEILELDSSTGGTFSKALEEVLADPKRSRQARDGAFRLPAGDGAYRLAGFLPATQSVQEDQEVWAFVMAAGIIASSEPGHEIENYLAFDAHRPFRSILFP